MALRPIRSRSRAQPWEDVGGGDQIYVCSIRRVTREDLWRQMFLFPPTAVKDGADGIFSVFPWEDSRNGNVLGRTNVVNVSLSAGGGDISQR